MPISALEQLAIEAAERGLLIESGWIGLRLAALPADVPPSQLSELRSMFFAGAHHLFASLISILDPGDVEPTEADLVRMGRIEAELKAFITDFAATRLPVKGTA